VGVETDSVEGRPTEDSELVERAKHGDEDAYAELVTRYQAVAARTAYVITGNDAEAEDAAQEGFVKAYFALDRFRPGAPFRPWLLRIVANEAINRRKAAGRRPTVALSVALDRPSPDTALSPEGTVLANERRDVVLGALRRMREEDRLVIAYRYFFDLSEAEMAEALGVARGTVKSRLSRAIGRLRAFMEGPERDG
jgi:RNA polymerase sigma factor (sigma-70 family)